MNETPQDKKEKWRKKAHRCTKSFDGHHHWIELSKKVTKISEKVTSEQVIEIMCGRCFHNVNLEEAWSCRECED